MGLNKVYKKHRVSILNKIFWILFNSKINRKRTKVVGANLRDTKVRTTLFIHPFKIHFFAASLLENTK